jgi:hypothetical protein
MSTRNLCHLNRGTSCGCVIISNICCRKMPFCILFELEVKKAVPNTPVNEELVTGRLFSLDTVATDFKVVHTYVLHYKLNSYPLG